MQAAGASADLARYYRSSAVRARIAEYCGGLPDAPSSFAAWHLAAYGGQQALSEADGGPVACENADLDRILAHGADVCRSLADRQGTLLQVDVDYVDLEHPDETYLRPEQTFRRLEPVYATLREVLAEYGIRPRAVMTGRGYHLTARARAGSPAHSALGGIATISDAVAGKGTPAGLPPAMARQMGLAHEGAGRVLEHVAHRTMHLLQGRTEVPVVLADLPPEGRGPFVCLDLTAYGDPLFQRTSRCAFSANQKSGLLGLAPGKPFVIALARRDQPLASLLRGRENLAAAAELAISESADIPDIEDLKRLVADYRSGPVGRFHADFDRGPEVGRDQWPFTYDTLSTSGLPGCLASPLDHPNPLLLRPSCLRTVALGLWGMGWHPRSIAGLIRSRYEQDRAWMPTFERYDAATRARFYVRVLCGAVADGLDSGRTFNCDTQARRGLCEPANCSAQGRRAFALLGPALDAKGRI